jgi:putative ABC transport system permease protein
LQVGLRSFPQYKLFEFGPGSQAVQLSIGRIFGILTALLNGLTILALVIASLGQINTMMASVMQRVRELGVLRSVGLTRQQVQMLVLLEAAAVGVIGAIVGMLAGTAAALAYLVVFYTAGVEGAGFGAPTWASVSSGIATALSTTQWIALLALAFAPLMTMVAAWLPAHRAANLPVIQTIRDI